MDLDLDTSCRAAADTCHTIADMIGTEDRPLATAFRHVGRRLVRGEALSAVLIDLDGLRDRLASLLGED